MLALITNSIEPYCYDIGHVLGLPDGGTHRFRYETQWIASDRFPDTRQDLSAVVVLRNFETAELIPCRYVEISRIHPTGNFYWVEFKVGGFPTEDDLIQLPQVIDDQFKSLSFANTPGQDLIPLVMPIEHVANYTNKEFPLTLWDRVVTRLGEVKCYKGYSFGYVVEVVPVGKEMRQNQNWRKALNTGYAYDLYIIQKNPSQPEGTRPAKEPYALALSSEDGKCKILRSHQRIVGRYDLLRYSFRTPMPHLGEQICTLAVHTDIESQPAYPPFPNIRFEIVVKPTIGQRAWALVRILSAFAAFFFFVFPEPFAWIIRWDENGVRALGMFLTLVATGSLNEILKTLSSSASKKLTE